MENELTDAEIQRVFAMYVPSKEKLFLNPDTGMSYYGTLYQLASMRGYFHEYKLLLTPLSKIRDEDAIEVTEIISNQKRNMTVQRENNRTDVWFGYACVHIYHDGSILHEGIRWVDSDAYEYLKIKSYAVPLFFGINHWANGKDAIALGIAIDKTIL